MRRAGCRDHDVGGRERPIEAAPLDDGAPGLLGERLGVCRGPAAHEQLRRILGREVPRRELGHVARADDEGGGAAQITAYLAGQANRREAHRDRAFGERRLAPHPLANRERRVEEAIQSGAGGLVFGGGRVSLLDLTQDLRLADDQGIEPRGHAKEVPRGIGLAARVEVRADQVGREVAYARKEGDQRFVALLEAAGRHVDLGAVARREQHRLAQGAVGRKPCQRRRQFARRNRQPLPKLDRRRVMAHAEDQQAHQSKAWLVSRYETGMRLNSTIAKPSAESQAARRPPHPIRRRE